MSASNLQVDLVQGDITEAATDAIVNAANNHFWMGAGVSGAIRRKGGEQVEREAVAQGPVRIGQAVATSAGNLPHRHVLHAAVMGQDLVTSEDLIREATRNVLALADRLQLQSIALPAFGTGVGGFPLPACARAMIEEVRRFPALYLRKVVFVLFDATAFEAFQNEL
ncbi:MAG: macro domain-containing protein [Acidobacteriota bacterium]